MTHGVWLDNNGGIGASADSFYEYLLKAYVLFGRPAHRLSHVWHTSQCVLSSALVLHSWRCCACH